MPNFPIKLPAIKQAITEYHKSNHSLDSIYIIEKVAKHDVQNKDKSIDLSLQGLNVRSIDCLYKVVAISKIALMHGNHEKTKNFDKIVLGDSFQSNGTTYHIGGYVLQIYIKINQFMSTHHGNPLKRLVIDPQMGALYISSICSHRYLVGANRAEGIVDKSDTEFYDINKKIIGILHSR